MCLGCMGNSIEAQQLLGTNQWGSFCSRQIFPLLKTVPDDRLCTVPNLECPHVIRVCTFYIHMFLFCFLLRPCTCHFYTVHNLLVRAAYHHHPPRRFFAVPLQNFSPLCLWHIFYLVERKNTQISLMCNK